VEPENNLFSLHLINERKKKFKTTKLGKFFLGNNNLNNTDKEVRLREYEEQKSIFHRKLKAVGIILLLGVVYFLILILTK